MLTLFIFTGCASNQNPPPPDDSPGVIDKNDVNNGTVNDGTGTNGTGTNNDINLDRDKDMMTDNNDPNEEVIEDDLDRKDADNKDR